MTNKREAKKMGKTTETYYCKELKLATTSHQEMTDYLWSAFVSTFKPEDDEELEEQK